MPLMPSKLNVELELKRIVTYGLAQGWVTEDGRRCFKSIGMLAMMSGTDASTLLGGGVAPSQDEKLVLFSTSPDAKIIVQGQAPAGQYAGFLASMGIALPHEVRLKAGLLWRARVCSARVVCTALHDTYTWYRYRACNKAARAVHQLCCFFTLPYLTLRCICAR